MTRAARILLAGGIATLLLALAPAAQADFGFVTKWGSYGARDGEFAHVSGIATDAADNVYVSDYFESSTGPSTLARIQRFSSNGIFLGKWGSPGEGDGQFSSNFVFTPGPAGVATDAAGHVYVADAYRIQKFNSSGVFLGKWGSYGDGDGEFKYASSIATDAAGNVYVGDASNRRIQKFSSDGVFLGKWGSHGQADGQFSDPTGVATDAAGNVYVADRTRNFDSTTNNRIQKFSSSGVFLGKWGSDGNGNGQFSDVTGIATDAAGNVYVADSGLYRIQKFRSDGAFLGKWGSQGDGDGQFQYMSGVATDPAGNVYIAEALRGRIQKFGLLLRHPKITRGPKGKTRKRKATMVFHFGSKTPGAHFECRLTGKRVATKLKRWRKCKSPKRYRRLKPGKKVFQVRAVLGKRRGKPDTRRWTVLP